MMVPAPAVKKVAGAWFRYLCPCITTRTFEKYVGGYGPAHVCHTFEKYSCGDGPDHVSYI